EQLETLRRARAGSGEPYSADEYISTLLRRDWERWQQQQAELAVQACPNCNCALPEGCAGTFKGDAACWHTTESKTLAL
ncbi:phage protein, partial [Aeromonas hydrophila]|uniref:phage protein n=2 Tax=Aeromonas TaxID=642 RepID=UPI000541BA6C